MFYMEALRHFCSMGSIVSVCLQIPIKQLIQ